MEEKIYVCADCKTMVSVIKEDGQPLTCGGEEMKELVPGTTEAAEEKHIPVYEVEGNLVNVCVGSVEHPMQPEHYIEWVSLQTKQGLQRKALSPEGRPAVCFALCDGDEVEAVYAYCNQHGLWKLGQTGN